MGGSQHPRNGRYSDEPPRALNSPTACATSVLSLPQSLHAIGATPHVSRNLCDKIWHPDARTASTATPFPSTARAPHLAHSANASAPPLSSARSPCPATMPRQPHHPPLHRDCRTEYPRTRRRLPNPLLFPTPSSSPTSPSSSSSLPSPPSPSHRAAATIASSTHSPVPPSPPLPVMACIHTPTFVVCPTVMVAAPGPPPSPTTRSSVSQRSLNNSTASKRIVSAAAAAADAAAASVDAAAAAKHRKRARPSSLARKYRDIADPDESLLISDDNALSHQLFSSITPSNVLNDHVATFPPVACAAPAPAVDTKQKRKSKSTNTHQKNASTLDRSQQQQFHQQQQQLLSRQQYAQKLKVAQSQKAKQPLIPIYSRFPSKWEDAVSQMCTSTALALAHGFDRIKLDVKNLTPYIEQHIDNPQSKQADEVALLTLAASSILSHLTATDDKNSEQQDKKSGSLAVNLPSVTVCPDMFKPMHNIRPNGALLVFNNSEDAIHGQEALNGVLPLGTEIGVLGKMNPSQVVGKLVVLVAPSNRKDNPTNIEHVELVHYSNFNTNNWVILLNEDLISLSTSYNLSGEPKSPLFLTDYIDAFYAHPIDFKAIAGCKGGILRCFPRKWELYMSKADDQRKGRGLRLVSEIKSKPSNEKVQCEFSWRLERELERCLNDNLTIEVEDDESALLG